MRLIDEEGENLGVFSLEEAQSKAQEADLDLIEIASDPNPPVAKIYDFDKFRYEKAKEKKEQKKKQKSSELKRVQITPRTAKHDKETKARRIKEFLNEGHKVEVSMYLKGREKANKGFAKKRLQEFLDEMIEVPFRVTKEATYTGRQFITNIVKK